jgi:rhodanese-related sulfurtransferase
MPKNDDVKRLADSLRDHITEISSAEARHGIAAGAVLIDIRDEDELHRNAPLAGAVHLSRGRLEYLISDAVSDKEAPIILYCAGGVRSILAADSLQMLGYTQVSVLRGGLRAWRDDAGQPWTSMRAYTGSIDSNCHF